MEIDKVPAGVIVRGCYVGGQTRTYDGKLKGFALISTGTDAIKIWLSNDGLAQMAQIAPALGDEVWMSVRPWAGDRGGLMYTQGKFI